MASTLTLADMRTQILQWADEDALRSPTLPTLVDAALNNANRQRALEYPWEWMLYPKTCTLSIVAGTTRYALHQEFHRPYWVYEPTTHLYWREVPQRMLAEQDPTHNAAEPLFTYGGVQPVKRQPSGSVVRAVSSSSADGSSVSVTLVGETAAGDVATETLTMNGTTLVTGTTSFDILLEVRKSAAFTGTLTLTDASSNTLLTLDAGEMGRSYRVLELLGAPTTATSVSYRFFRAPREMTADYDLPAVPGAHAQLLVWDALVQLSGYFSNVSPQTLGMWREQQMAAQVALYTAWANEQQTLNALPTQLRLNRGDWQ